MSKDCVAAIGALRFSCAAPAAHYLFNGGKVMPEEKQLTGYPSIDKPWLKYYSKDTSENPLQGKTVFTNIYSINASHPDDIALEYYGRKINYGKMFDSVERTKNALLACGIKKDDKVILFSTATPETVYVVLALCRIGAIANMINPLFTDEQCIDRINETGASLLIALDRLYSRISKVIPKTCIQCTVIIPVVQSMPFVTRMIASLKQPGKVSGQRKAIIWHDFLKMGTVFRGKAQTDTPYEKDHPLMMVYSTGSTGASKGIVLTNDGINATIRHYFSPDFPYERGDTFLQIVPVWFSTGIVLSVLMPLCLGITVILEPVFSGQNFANDLKKYTPHMTLNSISGWLYVKKEFENKKISLANLKYPASGGELILPRVETAMNSFLQKHGASAPLLTAYGMCELGSTITTDSDTYHKCGASGYPMTDVIVAAFDPISGKEQKYGERGELRVCSPARMKEYFKNPSATEEFFWKDAEGRIWGCTGDIGYVDEDGFVYVQGRAKDHFHRDDGEIVFLFDIEREILKEIEVDQCKVIYFMKGSKVETVAHVVFNQNNADNSSVLNRIHRRLINTLPDYMIPHYYKVRTAMPVNTNGKLDIKVLRNDREDLILAEELQ